MRVFARHFFSNADSIGQFPAIIRNLEHLAVRSGWPVEMIATFQPTFPPPPVDARNVKLTLAVSGADEGGGTKVWQGFFEHPQGMALLVDGDMQTFDAEELAAVQHLIGKMATEGKAFGCAARTVVRMHRFPELNNLRIAQEAFYLSFGVSALPDTPSRQSLDALHTTYRVLGDAFSGSIAINTAHPAASQVRAEVEAMRVRGLFNGFALEYYIGMRFAQLEQAVATYLQTKVDHTVTDRSAEAVREMIRKDWGELQQSPIGEALARHVQDAAVQRRVGELVGERAMREVLGLFG